MCVRVRWCVRAGSPPGVCCVCVKVAEKEKGEFDLVISDIGLPDGTGTQLMHTLRDRYNLRVRPAPPRLPLPLRSL